MNTTYISEYSIDHIVPWEQPGWPSSLHIIYHISYHINREINCSYNGPCEGHSFYYYLSIFLNSVKEIQDLLKYDKVNGYCT